MNSPYTGTIATPESDSTTTESDIQTTSFPRSTVADDVGSTLSTPTDQTRYVGPVSPHVAATHGTAVAAPVTHQAPLMAPPQPQVVMQQPQQRGAAGLFETLVMGLLVLVVAAVAAVAAFAVTESNAPTADEAAAYQRIASAEGELAGRVNGYAQGRNQGIIENQNIARYQALIAQAREFNKGWKQGMTDGKNMYRYRGGYGGYYGRTSSYSSGPAQVQSALASAQAIANATGSPVDVEIY